MAEQWRASHILVKHEESRRCASWRDEDGKQIRARSKDQATAILREYREKIVADPAQFEAIASTDSDCGSAAQGGDVGLFGPGEMQQPFEDAVKSLKVGELSDVVYTDSGAHIIKRTA
eukprot:m.478188 g.478188  ORF g.478188 m.478188 type:complete len:118 (+) comp21064_c0_seq1:140-493(+)